MSDLLNGVSKIRIKIWKTPIYFLYNSNTFNNLTKCFIEFCTFVNVNVCDLTFYHKNIILIDLSILMLLVQTSCALIYTKD